MRKGNERQPLLPQQSNAATELAGQSNAATELAGQSNAATELVGQSNATTSTRNRRFAALGCGVLSAATRIPYVTIAVLAGQPDRVAWEATKFGASFLSAIFTTCAGGAGADAFNAAVQGAVAGQDGADAVKTAVEGLSGAALLTVLSFGCNMAGAVMASISALVSVSAANAAEKQAHHTAAATVSP